MITGSILYLLYGLVSFIVALLPTIAFPSTISTAIVAVWYYVNAYSFLLPMSTLLYCLGVALTFHLVILGWRLLHLIGGYVRGR